MARIKRGVTKSRRHKETLKRAKGYRMSYHRLYKRAKEALLHAGQYEYAHRRQRRGQLRTSWIKILSAGLSDKGISYSKFVGLAAKKSINIDRKVLAEMAASYPEHFAQLVTQVQA
jgi:large subunit ribosomal protein L20